jgi:hypothetical protein
LSLLFPLHKGKYKKGPIADSTQEEVESKAAQVQNKNKHVISMPKFNPRVKKMILSDELKKKTGCCNENQNREE